MMEKSSQRIGTCSLWSQRLGVLCLLASVFVMGCIPANNPTQEPKKSKADLHFEFASNSFLEKNVRSAEKDLIIALDSDPDHRGANFLLGLIYFGRFRSTQANSDFMRSDQYFRKALEVDPDYGEARNNLGSLYLEVGRWSEAAEVLLPLLEDRFYSTPYLAHNNLGWAFYNMREYKRAEFHFQQAVAIEPDMCLAQSHLGEVYRALGRNDVAVMRFDRAISRCPEWNEPYWHLGQIYEGEGRIDLAIKSYEKCYELAPEQERGGACVTRANQLKGQ